MFEEARRRRKINKMYRKAIGAGLMDLGVRMRNDTARRLVAGETIVEDEAVLVGDAQDLVGSAGSGIGRWGWMILTSERVIWAAYPEKGRMEARLSDLDLMFSEDNMDTFRWSEQRGTSGWGRNKRPNMETVSVTLEFSKESEIRPALHQLVNDERHVKDA